MDISWKSLLPLITLVLTAACSPPLTEADMTATQGALLSSTPTKPLTPTALPPTLTATITLTPAITPVQVEVEIQDNGRTQVRNYQYRVQFELPAG